MVAAAREPNEGLPLEDILFLMEVEIRYQLEVVKRPESPVLKLLLARIIHLMEDSRKLLPPSILQMIDLDNPECFN